MSEEALSPNTNLDVQVHNVLTGVGMIPSEQTVQASKVIANAIDNAIERSRKSAYAIAMRNFQSRMQMDLDGSLNRVRADVIREVAKTFEGDQVPWSADNLVFVLNEYADKMENGESINE